MFDEKFQFAEGIGGRMKRRKRRHHENIFGKINQNRAGFDFKMVDKDSQ
jgi:hypothetical protein